MIWIDCMQLKAWLNKDVRKKRVIFDYDEPVIPYEPGWQLYGKKSIYGKIKGYNRRRGILGPTSTNENDFRSFCANSDVICLLPDATVRLGS